MPQIDLGYYFETFAQARGIVRRYFVVNGFDGALTMLGIIMGFGLDEDVDPRVVASACTGAGIALGISGISSAYISESAERRRALRELEAAMLTDLERSAHGLAARVVPLAVAIVNGLAPFLTSLLVILPVWLSALQITLPWSPLRMSLGIAFVVIFLFGVFLGRVSGRFWLTSGLRTLLVAMVTAGVIMLLHP